MGGPLVGVSTWTALLVRRHAVTRILRGILFVGRTNAMRSLARVTWTALLVRRHAEVLFLSDSEVLRSSRFVLFPNDARPAPWHVVVFSCLYHGTVFTFSVCCNLANA